MGNTTTSTFSPLPSRRPMGGQDTSGKQILILTDKPDGFYFTGEYLTGTFEIPISFVQQYFNNKTHRNLTEFLRQQSIRNNLHVEFVGDATYSAEVDVAADSNGHATHEVNVCRYACYVTIDTDHERQSIPTVNSSEIFSNDQSTARISDTQILSSSSPSSVKGKFQLQIPENLPPSLTNNRTPSLTYTLELSLSSSRSRYQIPIILSSKGDYPQLENNIQLTNHTISQHDIQLSGSVSKRYYSPGEQIPVQVNYFNPQQRLIRSIRTTLIQVYRIHNDEYCSQLDGKEWTFDMTSMSVQREWSGEVNLQLPYAPLQASFSNEFVGTTQQIECEVDYRIMIELSEKKGDDFHLTLPSITVTYQK